MVDVFVDPIIVATPHPDAAQDVVEPYLDNLLCWLEEALNSPHSWYYSNRATAALLECGLYPGSELLQHWKQKYKRMDVNIRRISNWVGQFFNPEFDLDNRLEYLVDPEIDSISIQPEQFSTRWPSLLRNEMHALLAKVGGCKHMGSLFACELCLATLALVNARKEMEISAKISASEPNFDWGSDNSFAQLLPLLFTPEDLPSPMDVLNSWDKGENGVRYVIDRWYAQYWHNTFSNPLSYRFSDSFFESIARHEIDAEELVLKKILLAATAIITNNTKYLHDKYNLRPKRISKAADDPQETRSSDDAKAWRITVIPEGAGWRMHYWKISTPDGSIIEFANVLKKHDPEEIY